MRVLQIHNHYRSSAPSGEDAVVDSEASLLERRGVEVFRFRKYNDDIETGSVRAKVELAVNTVWSSRSRAELKAEIKRIRPDVVHIHNTFPQLSPSVCAACGDENVPCVLTLHNYRHICASALLSRDGVACELCVGRMPLPAVRYRCYRDSLAPTLTLVGMQVYNRARGSYRDDVDQYICLTNFAASKFVQAGFPGERIQVKPNFIVEFPTEIRAPSNYAVFAGRLSREKGVHTLLEAWRVCRDIPLKVLGDGPERARLEAFASEHGLNVDFRGYVSREEVVQQIAQARLVIVPSECYEGFPMVVVEAFAHGVPVIASALGSLDEIVEENVTGLKFPAGDDCGLTEAVNKLYADEALRARLARGAREKALREFTAEANYVMLDSIYEAARQRRHVVSRHGRER